MIEEYTPDFVFNENNVYLKIVGFEILSFGDMPSLEEAEKEYKTGKLFDIAVSLDEWEANDGIARLVNGKIVLGIPKDQKREKQEEVIRNERYLRLRQCDKISPMRWNAMTEEQRQAWTDYRIALLDVPQQKGFPWGGDASKVPWPKEPE
jgi:hypothetical protein